MATDEDGPPLASGSSRMPDVMALINGMPTTAMAASVALHGILLLCLVSASARVPGANGRSLDAIGVEIIDAAALDIAVPREIPDGRMITGAARSRVDPSVPEQPPGETALANPGDVAEASTAPAAIVGGVAVSGAGQDDASARSAAAIGPTAARYALTVREAIGRARPRHMGVKGHVEVAFGLSALGLVRFAEVTRTSGIGRLDEAALKAVHTASFPTPPVGLTETHLSFVVPFNFR